MLAVGSAPKLAVGGRQSAEGRGQTRCVAPALPSCSCRLPSAGFSSLPSALSHGSWRPHADRRDHTLRGLRFLEIPDPDVTIPNLRPVILEGQRQSILVLLVRRPLLMRRRP